MAHDPIRTPTSFKTWAVFFNCASLYLLCSQCEVRIVVAGRSEIHMLKYLLAFALTMPFPLCGSGQSYADAPFYRPISAVPSTAFVEGWAHGSIKANGVVIDLSMSNSSSSPNFDEIRGWNINSWVDKKNPAHTFHYYFQYNQLKVVFAYDLLVEPIPGTDEIRCTFGALTDPDELPRMAWTRDKSFPVVALPGDLTPFVVKSGGVIAFTTLPLGPGKIAVDHYLRLTRADLTPDSE